MNIGWLNHLKDTCIKFYLASFHHKKIARNTNSVYRISRLADVAKHLTLGGKIHVHNLINNSGTKWAGNWREESIFTCDGDGIYCFELVLVICHTTNKKCWLHAFIAYKKCTRINWQHKIPNGESTLSPFLKARLIRESKVVHDFYSNNLRRKFEQRLLRFPRASEVKTINRRHHSAQLSRSPYAHKPNYDNVWMS